MAKGQFFSKVAGVSRKNQDGSDRQKYIRAYCKPGMPLILKREPDNPADSNAISVWIKARFLGFDGEVQIGYLSREVAEELAPVIDGGGEVAAKISDVTGGTNEKATRGVNIQIEKSATKAKHIASTPRGEKPSVNRKPFLLGLILIILCACLALGINRSEKPAGEAAQPAAVASVLTLPPAPTEPPAPTPTPEPTVTPAPTATPEPPQVFEGVGDAVLELGNRSGPGLVWARGNAEAGHFAVASYNEQGQMEDLLVNTTEPYQGYTWLNAGGLRLEVNAEGPWSIVVSSLAAAAPQTVPGQLAGQGDTVLALLAPADTARFAGNQTARNFAVIGYNEMGQMEDLLVNTTDPYEGQVLVKSGIKYLVVSAVGDWKMAIE
jgi:hypothetical protein